MVILMQSYYENYLKNHLIGTNISVKLGTVPICIGIGIGVGQWKHTIRKKSTFGRPCCAPSTSAADFPC